MLFTVIPSDGLTISVSVVRERETETPALATSVTRYDFDSRALPVDVRELFLDVHTADNRTFGQVHLPTVYFFVTTTLVEVIPLGHLPDATNLTLAYMFGQWGEDWQLQWMLHQGCACEEMERFRYLKATGYQYRCDLLAFGEARARRFWDGVHAAKADAGSLRSDV